MSGQFGLVVRFFAAAVALVTITAGCGSLTPDSLAYANEDATVAKESVIRIATPRIRGLEQAIDDWEREHPTARVEIVVRSIDDHHRSVLDDAGAGGLFDVIGFEAAYGPDVRERSELFLDLEAIDGDVAESDYLSSRWREGIGDDGRLIGLPIDVDSVALAVRSDMVDPALVDRLEAASTWCELIATGDAFSDATGMAFLPDGDEVFTTVLSQNRLSFIEDSGAMLPDEAPELERAWDLTMLAIGSPPLHGTPCATETGAEGTEIARITRDLAAGGSQWRDELRADGFAAVLARYSELRAIAAAAPDTTGQWTAVELPGKSGPSAGGIHLGISKDSTHADLAFDLVSYLANPIIQKDAFADGSGPFPAASVIYGDPTITEYSDPFFGDAPIGAIFASTATRRPTELAGPLRRIVIELFVSALNRVEDGTQTPDEAWDDALWRIDQFLG
jgi:cellobiose transport system substrate-binding protein